MKKDLASLPCLFLEPDTYSHMSDPEHRTKKQVDGPSMTTWNLKF